jgi:type II secretory pathway pseudopilin PulG
MNLRSRRGERGFTLAEALAAMLFLAIVLPPAVHAFQVSGRAAVSAERLRIAGDLAESKLTELVLTGGWRTGPDAGDFEPDYPGYSWTVSADGWEEDAMRVVTVEVTYMVQGRERTVRLATLAAGEEL